MWASDIARQQHASARRKLVREAADRESRAIDTARSDLLNAERRLKNQEVNRRLNMVGAGMTPRLRAVMNSWGLNLPLNITPARTVSAMTDFKQITVNYDRRLTPVIFSDEPQPDMEAPVDEETLRQLAAELRGCFYHEVGHNLYTVPVRDLLTAAVAEGWSHPSLIANNGQQTVTRELQHSWNVLEDQRMEMALVMESPQIAAYLTVMTLRLIVGNHARPETWLLVAGRRYLPASVRKACRDLWNNDPLMSSRATSDQALKIVYSYMTAVSASDMLSAVVEMMTLLQGITPKGVDGHGGFPDGGSEGEPATPESTNERLREINERLKEDAPEEADPQSAPSKDSSKGDEDGDASDEDGEGGSNGSSEGDFGEHTDGRLAGDGGGKDSNDPNWKAQSNLHEALGDALDALEDDENLDGDIASMNEAYASNDASLPPYGKITAVSDEDALTKSKAIVDDIIRAFELATSNCDPHWESQQRRGYLEPVRYATRRSGDMEFFRGYVDNGDPGHDIAVSLFLDISGSMMGTENEIGATAWAVKSACDRLGIDCDVTLFNEQGYTLWTKADRASEDVPAIEPSGGTQPLGAFDGILFEENDKKNHIVLVMTDGAWGSGADMARYKHSNTTSVIFYYDGYNRGNSKGVVPNQRLATQKGADEGYDIHDLMDIPQVLESILLGLV
jgi:hypothetical protein